MVKSVSSAAFLSLTVLLTGCGGGGGGDSTVATTVPAGTTFPLQKALVNLYTTGYQKTVSVSGTGSANGTQYPITGSVLYTESPANVGVTFAGQAALQKTISIMGTLTVNNQTSNLATTAQNYLTTNYNALGITSPTSYCVANTSGQYPATVTIGQTGSVVTYACYTNSTKATPTGTDTVSYVISAGTSSTTATVSSIEVLVNTANQQIASTRTNYLIDTSGGISFNSVSVNLTISGVQVDFTGQ